MTRLQNLLGIIVLLLLASCEDPDTELPNVEISITKSGLVQDITKSVYGGLTFEVSASDNDELKKVVLIYEGAVLAESANSTLTFLWDSRTVEDGQHAFTVYVEDNAGNFIEENLALSVSNFLMSFSTVEYVASISKYYVFLSDNQGNVLEYKLLEDRKEKVVFNRPETESETYQLTVVSTFNNHYWINTYVNVPSGDYFVKSLFVTQPPSVGKHTLLVPDRNTYGVFFMESEKGISFNPVNNHTQYDIQLSSENTNLFLGISSSAYPGHIYYFDPEIKTGETTTVDNALITHFIPMNSSVVDLMAEQSTIGFASVFGNSENRSTLVSFTNLDQHKLMLYYPPITIFKDFTSEVFYSAKVNTYTVYHHLIQKAMTPVNTKDILTVQISSLDSYSTSNLKLAATGTADYIKAFLNVTEGSITAEWSLYAPMQSTYDIKLPALPDQFLAAHNLTFLKDKKFISISFSDIPAISSYGELITQELKKDYTGKNVSIPDLKRSINFQIP